MANPYENRVKSLINVYRSNPHLFNDEQLDELQEIANQSGIKFSPIREEFRLSNVVKQVSSGFLEGLTTVPTGEKPRTTYESIAHSLGHLVGFAPGIMAGPLSLGAKGLAKLGAKGVSKGLMTTAELASKNISVPMMFGDWVTEGAKKGLSKAGAETYDFMRRGATTRAIGRQAVHLGAASTISAIWQGPDAMTDAMIGGAIAGGMFGGLGEFRAIGNLLRTNNISQNKRAEQMIKSGIGATMLGGPAYMRDEPVEAILYETILGGYFGYKSRPAIEAQGGKFIRDLAYHPEKDIIFTPEKHPEFNQFSKGAKEYIMNSATEQSQTYLRKQYPDISDADFNTHFRLIAEKDFGKNPSPEQINTIMRQEATQHYFGNYEYARNPFESPNRSQEPSFEQQEDYNQPVDKAPKTTNLDVQKGRFEDKPVFVVEVTKDGKLEKYNIRNVEGEYQGARLGDNRVDRPIDNLQNVNFTELNKIYIPPEKGGLFWKSYKPLQTEIVKGKLEFNLKSKDWWRIDNNLDRQNHYVYSGVKDKGTLLVRPYHIDASIEGMTIENVIRNLSKDANGKINGKDYRDLQKDYENSLDIEAEWYGKSREEVQQMHDKKWKSNVLSEAEANGFYLSGSGNLNNINRIMKDGFIKNVTDLNKRMQLNNDKTLPLPNDTFRSPLRTIILNDYIDVKNDTYTVRGKDGKIESKYNESNTDGTILFTPERFNRMMDKVGLPTKNVAMNKPVIMFKHGGGVLKGKSAGAVAEGPMLEFMKQNNLDVVMFNSAVKQKGELKSHDYWYLSKNKRYEADFNRDTDVFQLDPSSIRINLGTFVNPKKMYGTHFVKQFLGNLNDVQTGNALDVAFKEYYQKSYEGTEKARNAIDEFFKTGNDKLIKNIDIYDMPVRYIQRIWDAHYNTKAGKAIREQLFKLEEQGYLEEIERFTKEEYRDYLARNDRIINITEASESSTKLFKHTRTYADRVYKKFMIQRLLAPKYKYSAKAWLGPKLPHVDIAEGTFKAGKDFNPTVKVGEKEMKLKELWDGKDKAEYKEALDFAIIRVPSDSVSGTRVLRFDGYVGEKGVDVYTRSNDNTYLGGADKDSDSVFLYQGLKKTVLNAIKKHSKEWQRKDGTWIEGQSKKYDELLRGLEDVRFNTKGSKFSPGMRMIVAGNAAKGNEGLGFSAVGKNTMLAWIDVLNKMPNKEYTEKGMTIRLKNDGAELRRLAREMINTSADAANFPNITDYNKWRDALFETTFEAKMNSGKDKGKKIGFGAITSNTSLGDIHRAQNIINPKGKNYNKKGDPLYTYAEFQESLTKLAEGINKSGGNNFYSKIAKEAVKMRLNEPIDIDTVINHHKILQQANKRLWAINQEADFIRKLTQLNRFRVDPNKNLEFKIQEQLRKKPEERDWNKVIDFVANDTFNVASNNAMAKQGLNIYKAFLANGINKPDIVINSILSKIAEKATIFKRKHERFDPMNIEARDSAFKEYDAEINDYKVSLLKSAKENNIDFKLLSDYFDLWMISPFEYKSPKTRKGGVSRLPMQSQEISNDAWSSVMKEYENIYQNIKTKAEGGEVKESALFKLPKDYNQPIGKEDKIQTGIDNVKVNLLDKSPLKREISDKTESVDNTLLRKALGNKDVKEVESFKDNLKTIPKEHIDHFIEGTTLDLLGSPKTIKDLNMTDIRALNSYLKEINSLTMKTGTPLPDWAYWADPRAVDEVMWAKEKTFYNSGYKVPTAKGEKRPIFKGLGTLGTLRNWFRHVNTQQDVYTDAIPDVNNKKYNFRIEVTPNEELAIMRGILSKTEGKPEFLQKVEKKYLDRKYKVEGKEYTYEEIVNKYKEVFDKDLKEFGDQWLFAKDKKGNKMDFESIDKKQQYGEYNEYLKWDKNGKFDIENFIKRSVTPGDRVDGRIPIIPMENIYRFQYEYRLERRIKDLGLTGKKANNFRIDYRLNEKTKFEGVGEVAEGSYFPHLNFGWNKGARAEIDSYITRRAEEVYNDAISRGVSKKEAEGLKAAKVAELYMKRDASMGDTGGMDRHAFDDLISRKNYKGMSEKEIGRGDAKDIAFNTRPENILNRTENMPGYDIRSSVIDTYKTQAIRAHYRNLASVMANYRIDKFIEKNPMGDFSKADYRKYNPEWQQRIEYFKNWSDVWGDYLRFYVRDAFGHQSTFSRRIVDSMKHGDPLKLKNTMYKMSSDQNIIQALDKIEVNFKKYNIPAPFMKNIPKVTAKKGSAEYIQQVERRKQYISDLVHQFGKLEARFELLTLLANTGTMTGNLFGGSTMTIASAGFRNFSRVQGFKWMKNNVLFDSKGNPTLNYVNNQGKRVSVKTKEDLNKWIQDKGVIDNFIKDELQHNARLKDAMGKNARTSKEFIKELRKVLKNNPNAKDETLIELANRYGLKDTMLKYGGVFMQASERKLRRDAFLSHVLQAKDRLGIAGKNMSLNDPYLVDAGLKGIEATQFLYHSAFRPAFMRTSLGKVLTRFKLFAFQSIRTRKELLKRAKYYGFKAGTKDYENMKDLFLTDMFVFALAAALPYSLFDSTLPPPYDYIQESSEWLFGDKRERERAFFGTYPRPIAPLQIVTPPSARVIINPLKAMFNNDWESFMDYHIHTMYPFGRIVRGIDKTMYDPEAGDFEMIKEQRYGTTFGRFMQQFLRLPTDKIVGKYDRAQLQKERSRIIEETLGE